MLVDLFSKRRTFMPSIYYRCKDWPSQENYSWEQLELAKIFQGREVYTKPQKWRGMSSLRVHLHIFDYNIDSNARSHCFVQLHTCIFLPEASSVRFPFVYSVIFVMSVACFTSPVILCHFCFQEDLIPVATWSLLQGLLHFFWWVLIFSELLFCISLTLSFLSQFEAYLYRMSTIYGGADHVYLTWLLMLETWGQCW